MLALMPCKGEGKGGGELHSALLDLVLAYCSVVCLEGFRERMLPVVFGNEVEIFHRGRVESRL